MIEENYQKIVDSLRKDFKTIREINENQWNSINKNAKQLGFLQRKVIPMEERLNFLEKKIGELAKTNQVILDGLIKE